MVFSFLHSLLQKQVYSQSPYKKVDNSEVTKKKKKKGIIQLCGWYESGRGDGAVSRFILFPVPLFSINGCSVEV